MKHFFLLIITTFSLFSFQDYEKDEKIPRKIRRSIPLLADYLTKDAKSEKEKVKAIYQWITSNIAYNYDQLQSNDYFTGVNPRSVLKQKKAICGGYVELMKAMLDELNIGSETVNGYVHNEYWSPGMLVLTHSHAWISFYINGEWFLADPTWDAGYIGRLPIERKPYIEKVYKKNEFKNSARKERILIRRETKAKKRKEAYDDLPTHSDKIGFVKQPDTNYLFIDSDTFLLNHLPVNPIWQLRKDYISIEDFALNTDSLKTRLLESNEVEFDFERKIGDYVLQDYLHKLISSAESGFEYNPYNPGIKALNYYNFVALVQNKKLQKLARGSVYALTQDKYPSLMDKNDTIIKYNKLLKSFASDNYKAVKSFDKSNYKSSQQSDKVITKSMRIITLENEKLVKYSETSSSKIKSNMAFLSKELERIEAKYPSLKTSNTKVNLEKTELNTWIDSLRHQYFALSSIDSSFSLMYNDSRFNSILSDVGYINYLLKVNGNIIKYNTHSNNSKIEEIDSIICVESAHAIMLYKDSVRFEIINNEVMSIVKKTKSMAREAVLTQKSEATKIQAELYEILKLAETININCLVFNDEVQSVMKNYKEIKTLNTLAENQKKFKREKNEFVVEDSKTSSERDTKLVKKIASDSRAWKKDFAAKIKG